MTRRSGSDSGFLFIALAALLTLAGAAAAQFPVGLPPATAIDGAGTATPTATACSFGSPYPWAVRSPQPTALYASGATNDGTVVYVAGGSPNGGTVIDTFRSYNPTTNSWTTLASMTDSIALPLTVYAPNTGKVYAFGGDYFQGSISNLTRIYDPGTNSWSSGTVMPAQRWGMSGGYYNGRIYMAGGKRRHRRCRHYLGVRPCNR